jgi:hypothetical protein
MSERKRPRLSEPEPREYSYDVSDDEPSGYVSVVKRREELLSRLGGNATTKAQLEAQRRLQEAEKEMREKERIAREKTLLVAAQEVKRKQQEAGQSPRVWLA